MQESFPRFNIREVIELVVKRHPKECIFAPNAVENIIARVALATDAASFLNICEEALQENEIYCPHEGIDRRHLYPDYVSQHKE